MAVSQSPFLGRQRPQKPFRRLLRLFPKIINIRPLGINLMIYIVLVARTPLFPSWSERII
jgi:hypothetical protein